MAKKGTKLRFQGFRDSVGSSGLSELEMKSYQYLAITKGHTQRSKPINPSSPDYTIWHKIFNVFDHEMKNFQDSVG